MGARVTIVNPRREGSGNRYMATLLLNGSPVGVIERGWTQGGRGQDYYVAKVGRLTVASAERLDDLRAELRDPNVILDIEQAAANAADDD